MIELMLALCLSTLILSGFFHLYFYLQKQIKIQADMRYIQFTAYSVLQTLRDDIKRVGFVGCGNINIITGSERFNLQNENSIVIEKDAITFWYVENSQPYSSHGEGRRINRRRYYLKANRYQPAKTSLYLKINDDMANEIAQGVSQMQTTRQQQAVSMQFEFVTASLKSLWYLYEHCT